MGIAFRGLGVLQDMCITGVRVYYHITEILKCIAVLYYSVIYYSP